MSENTRPQSSGSLLIALPIGATPPGSFLEIYRVAYEQARQATLLTPLDFARRPSSN